MKTLKENSMFTVKKLITIILVMSFGLQGCAKGVTPTDGNLNYVDSAPNSPEVTNALCADKGGDSDGDGTCDDDERLAGTDPKKAITDPVKDESDGDSKPLFSRWWFDVGLVVLGTAGFIFGRNKAKSGKWFYRAPDMNNQEAGLIFMPTEKNATAVFQGVSSESFYTESGHKQNRIVNDVTVLHADVVLNQGNGKASKYGHNLLSCFHASELGTYALSDDPYSHFRVSMYFKDAYLKAGGSIISEFKSKGGFLDYCKNNTGIFIAIQMKDGADNYFVKGAPTELFSNIIQDENAVPLGYKSGVTVDYRFGEFNHQWTNLGAVPELNGLSYYRHLPGNEDADHSTLNYIFSSSKQLTGTDATAKFKDQIEASTTELTAKVESTSDTTTTTTLIDP
jgi:hypothetical protein